jgi:hypothetical protein
MIKISRANKTGQCPVSTDDFIWINTELYKNNKKYGN